MQLTYCGEETPSGDCSHSTDVALVPYGKNSVGLCIAKGPEHAGSAFNQTWSTTRSKPLVLFYTETLIA